MVPEAIEQLGQYPDLKSSRAAPFYVFVLVCDQAKEMNCRAALKFQDILSGPRHRMSPIFCQMLDFCRETYQVLWRGYARSTLTIDLEGFVEIIRNLRSEVTPGEYEEVERDLARLARALYRASFVFLPRDGKRQAYVDLSGALRRGDLPPSTRDLRARQRKPPDGSSPAARGENAAPAARVPEAPAEAGPERGGSTPPDAASRAPSAPVSPAAGSSTRQGTPLPALPGPNAAWAKGSLNLVCVRVTEEARDVKTFSFASNESTWFRHQPGQFMTIEPVIEGKPVPRSYTIASTPTRPGLLEITVKRVPGGVVSNWLHENMHVGKELRVRGPFGKFTCLNCPRDKYLFLSAGSGITPVMSMLRYLYDLAAPVDVVFFHSASTEQDIIFRRELAFYAERDPRFRVFISLTADPDGGGWEGLRGRLDNEMLQRIAPDFMERMVLACGPSGFMDKARLLLAGNNFPLETQFDEESFVPKQKRSEDRKQSSSGEKFKVVFVKSSKTHELCAEETILEAAERCGIEIPSSCRQGRCGTCRATKLSGDVIMPDQEALSPDEIAAGEILTCVGKAKSSIVEVEL